MTSTYDDLSVGARLAELRKKSGWTQRQLANELGVSLRTYQNYERGDRPVSKDFLCALRERHSVDVGWLLTGAPTASMAVGKIDAHLLDEVVDALQSEESELRGLRVEHLLPYAVRIYNEVCTIGDIATRRTLIESMVRVLGISLFREQVRGLQKTAENPETPPAVRLMGQVAFAPALASAAGRTVDEFLEEAFERSDATPAEKEQIRATISTAEETLWKTLEGQVLADEFGPYGENVPVIIGRFSDESTQARRKAGASRKPRSKPSRTR